MRTEQQHRIRPRRWWIPGTVIALLAAVVPLRTALAQTDPPPFDEDIVLLAHPDGVLRAPEGSSLAFYVYLAQDAPRDVVVGLEVLFARAGDDAAAPRDLVDDGTITPSGDGSRYFIEVPVATGERSARVEIATAEDDVRNEGTERFRIAIIGIRDVTADLDLGPNLELEIDDATPVPTPTPTPDRPDRDRPNRNRPNRNQLADRPPIPTPTPTPDPIAGPIAAGGIGYSIEGRTVTLHLPSSTRVWMMPNGPVRLLVGDDDRVIGTERGTPATISFEVPEDVRPPITITVQARLRTGAEYREPVVLTPPTD